MGSFHDLSKYKPIEQMTEDDFKAAIADPWWRLNNLYKIILKESADGGDALVGTIKFNRAQQILFSMLWHRNIILKARQLGFTTAICIYFLDCMLFGVGNQRAAIIAHREDDAKKIFRDKVKFAYEHLPDIIKSMCPLKTENADELIFAHNNNSIQVAVSVRSGTIHMLHVSEFGKICAQFPKRAAEIVTGSFPAVPQDGLIFIESTAEGQDGYYYKMCNKAEALAIAGKQLAKKEYRFHFFPWWEEQNYRANADGVVISGTDCQYFEEVEAQIGRTLDAEQRAWWVLTRDNDFAGQDENMWQEYPSYPAEAFKKSNEGAFYRVQMARARKERRITTVKHVDGYPVHTFWDIGAGDGTAIWLVQQVGVQYRIVGFIEGWAEPYAYYVNKLRDWMEKRGAVFGEHFLPHDGDHVRQGMDNNYTPRQQLEILGLRHINIVPRINQFQDGIQLTRDLFSQFWFDEEECAEGIAHLDAYHKKWVNASQSWSDMPEKDDGHSESADALRQLAQAINNKMIGSRSSNKIVRRGSYRTV